MDDPPFFLHCATDGERQLKGESRRLYHGPADVGFPGKFGRWRHNLTYVSDGSRAADGDRAGFAWSMPFGQLLPFDLTSRMASERLLSAGHGSYAGEALRSAYPNLI